ncbi:hypothetical protein BDV96DRAFT_693099, partial [Lophiotrema nucula]
MDEVSVIGANETVRQLSSAAPDTTPFLDSIHAVETTSTTISICPPSPRSSSLWDPNENEFDRWPGDGHSRGTLNLPKLRNSTIIKAGSQFKVFVPSATVRRIAPQGVGTARSAASTNVFEDPKGLATATVSSLSSNIWDPDDREFPHWPKGEEDDGYQQAVAATLASYRKSSGTYARFLDGQHDEDQINDEHRQIVELADPQLGEPTGVDLHDDLMQNFFSPRYHRLPPSYPARHMHVINHQSYKSAVKNDNVTQYVRPRLCDGVATVLFNTTPRCLEDFLDPRIKVFEWRRTIHDLASGHVSAIIRRSGSDVLVGTYRNYGHLYRWVSYARSVIDFTGKWTETFAAPSSGGTTPLSSKGPAWEEFMLNDSSLPETAKDLKCALYVGRCLAFELVWQKYWTFLAKVDVEIEWEADGKVVESKRFSNRGLFEGYGDDEDSD